MSQCPENIYVEISPNGQPLYNGNQYRGPHHWAMVGRWADVQVHTTIPGLYHRGDDGKTMVQAECPPYETRVDRPVYQCVYCLEEKRSTPPIQ